MRQAIDKLRSEMEGAKNEYVILIGEFLLEQLKSDENLADGVLQEGKTISGSVDAMTAVARKRQSKGMALMTSEEGFNIVLKYFGVEGTHVQIEPKVIHEPPKKQIISVNLDELL